MEIFLLLTIKRNIHSTFASLSSPQGSTSLHPDIYRNIPASMKVQFRATGTAPPLKRLPVTQRAEKGNDTAYRMPRWN